MTVSSSHAIIVLEVMKHKVHKSRPGMAKIVKLRICGTCDNWYHEDGISFGLCEVPDESREITTCAGDGTGCKAWRLMAKLEKMGRAKR